MQIIEYAQAGVGLYLRPQLVALRLVDTQSKAGLRDSQDRLAAATHQKHEGRRDRHAAPAVPSDAIPVPSGRVEVFSSGDSLFESRRIFDPVLFEQVRPRGEQ